MEIILIIEEEMQMESQAITNQINFKIKVPHPSTMLEMKEILTSMVETRLINV